MAAHLISYKNKIVDNKKLAFCCLSFKDTYQQVKSINIKWWICVFYRDIVVNKKKKIGLLVSCCKL